MWFLKPGWDTRVRPQLLGRRAVGALLVAAHQSFELLLAIDHLARLVLQHPGVSRRRPRLLLLPLPCLLLRLALLLMRLLEILKRHRRRLLLRRPLLRRRPLRRRAALHLHAPRHGCAPSVHAGASLRRRRCRLAQAPPLAPRLLPQPLALSPPVGPQRLLLGRLPRNSLPLALGLLRSLAPHLPLLGRVQALAREQARELLLLRLLRSRQPLLHGRQLRAGIAVPHVGLAYRRQVGLGVGKLSHPRARDAAPEERLDRRGVEGEGRRRGRRRVLPQLEPQLRRGEVGLHRQEHLLGGGHFGVAAEILRGELVRLASLRVLAALEAAVAALLCLDGL
mmetsp:Transcript_39801/g.124764  ORF Transcript_39801/g.124764 Transcript_39801/m.124764 type:complete len:337 (-) Transcript_39801:168-1178(-)